MRTLDTSTWARRDAFEYFRGFDKPFFNVCVRLDVAPLKAALAGRGGLSLACYFIALRLANEQEAMRLRLDDGQVRVHEVVHGSTTVLREDGESFGFADMNYDADFARFAMQAGAAIEAARTTRSSFEPKPDDAARVHFTTLPWLHFSSFSHARQWNRPGRREDSVPKLAFGRTEADGARLWMPMSVEVHHALMDGLHVGRFVQGFEALLLEPQGWMAPVGVNPPARPDPGRPTTA
jgi:chloramphenicol O-acetyltransferase type A